MLLTLITADGTFHQTIKGGGDPCDVVITSVNELLLVNSTHNCAYKLTYWMVIITLTNFKALVMGCVIHLVSLLTQMALFLLLIVAKIEL